MQDLEQAIGQYVIYRDILEETASDYDRVRPLLDTMIK
jgi:hypothetical protein